MYEIPKRSKPDESAPSIKYLMPDSEDCRLFLFNEAKTYKLRLCNSNPINIANKSLDETITIIPSEAKLIKIGNSYISIFNFLLDDENINKVEAEPISINTFIVFENSSFTKLLLKPNDDGW
tara:strand:- start:283 stop:648 length:366 start_codon:yes stop_codon:yes gene_type:complete